MSHGHIDLFDLQEPTGGKLQGPFVTNLCTRKTNRYASKTTGNHVVLGISKVLLPRPNYESFKAGVV